MTFNKFRRIIAFLICLVMLAGLTLTGCGKDGGNGGAAETYDIWIITGEDSSYYDSYDKNPVVEYLETMTWGPDKKKVNLDFIVPIAGQQSENFNTLLSTGDYPDVMNTVMYNGSIVDLYDQGTILDISEYVEQYMPNYMAFLAANPDIAEGVTYVVDGKKKYLSIRTLSDQPGYAWGGYSYRRDWIVKYGTNPVDGSAFSGQYTATNDDGSPNMDSWSDNVVFPGGETDPVYISDWEWMLDIFAQAISDLGITDGYPMSIYYPGFLATGDLYCAFGGGGPLWYKNLDGQIAFGATSDDFRVYLQAMSTWYSNGWIDKAFTEHASDMFFTIDDAKVRSGKIGLWWGLQSQLIGKLDDGEDLKAGMVVYGARQPMNDIYGTAAQQNVTPYAMFQGSLVGDEWIFTDKLKDRDIATLLSLVDYMYSEEGSLLAEFGLNKAQYEVTRNELYTRYGLTEGAYYRVPDDLAQGSKVYTRVDLVENDPGMLKTAVTAPRLFKLNPHSKALNLYQPALTNSHNQWIYYKNTGSITDAVQNQITPDEQKLIAKTSTNINEFLSKSVPPFIQGEKDPFSDADWEAFVKAQNKYAPDKITQIYQEKQNNLNG